MQFSKKISDKLKTLPDEPGVYFMRNRSGKVIYVGKASSLRNRVGHYFQPSTFKKGDPKLRSLIEKIRDFDFLVLKSEEEAAVNEGRLIKEYQPRYNVLAKDSKRFMMLKIDTGAPYPRFEFCRFKKSDGATYFGPFTSSSALRTTREFVEREFGLRLCRPRIPDQTNYKHCNNDIIRFCSAPCVGKISQNEYNLRVAEACAFLRGERPRYIKQLKQDMEKAAATRDYEQAAVLRDTIKMIRQTLEQKIRAPKSLQVKAEEAKTGVTELQEVLGMDRRPKIIECYDISNISGTLSVGSMVCAIDGRPRRNRYRHFRIKTVEGADDPRSMAEVVGRRIERALKEGKQLPDLIVCDGGITQVRATMARIDSIFRVDIPVIGLAKKFEEIVRDIGGRPITLRLPLSSKALVVLRNLRDEAHRFAITYHRKLRNQRISESILDDIPGIGARKKEVLLKEFGSIARLRKASLEELRGTDGIGPKLATVIHRKLHKTKTSS